MRGVRVLAVAVAAFSVRAVWKRRRRRLALMPVGITKASGITMRRSMQMARLINIPSVASGTLMDTGHMTELPFVRHGVEVASVPPQGLAAQGSVTAAKFPG